MLRHIVTHFINLYSLFLFLIDGWRFYLFFHPFFHIKIQSITQQGYVIPYILQMHCRHRCPLRITMGVITRCVAWSFSFLLLMCCIAACASCNFLGLFVCWCHAACEHMWGYTPGVHQHRNWGTYQRWLWNQIIGRWCVYYEMLRCTSSYYRPVNHSVYDNWNSSSVQQQVEADMWTDNESQ